MGEDMLIYSESQSDNRYNPQSYLVKLDTSAELDTESAAATFMDPYCGEDKAAAIKAIHGGTVLEFNENRPHLHHVSSLSTSCTSDSFNRSVPSTESGEAAFELNSPDPQEFEWNMHSPHVFQWPANHNLATPPLESPMTFQAFHGYQENVAAPHRQAFSTSAPEFYPFSIHPHPQSAFSFAASPPFPKGNTMDISQRSAETSQSNTPTILSPGIAPPRHLRKSSMSADIRNRGNSLLSDGNETCRPDRRRRASVSTSQNNTSRSPNRHQRRSSVMSTFTTFPEESPRLPGKSQNQIKRSKSASTILVNPSQEPSPPTASFTESAIVENESSDDITSIPLQDSAKTKAARAQSEHRRRVELKDSFERLRVTLGVPQPRAGKKDLVEQAISALEFFKQKEGELMQEIQYLQRQVERKYHI